VADGAILAQQVDWVRRWWETLYETEQRDNHAGTIMHELGHSLGLLHGGNDDVACKPNYMSVMGYLRQFQMGGVASNVPGVADGNKARLNRELDYSYGASVVLYEGELYEGSGIGSPATGARTIYFCGAECSDGSGQPAHNLVSGTGGAINWNGSTEVPFVPESPISGFVDINGVVGRCAASPNEWLSDHDDWRRVWDCIQVPVVAAASMYVQSASADSLDFGEEELGPGDYLDSALGTTDADVDGLQNIVDNCPIVANISQEDQDLDGSGDACDCAPTDGASQAQPSEVLNLMFTAGDTLNWEAPRFRGAVSVSFDVIRSETPSDFTSATCIVSHGAEDRTAYDSASPLVHDGFFYLVRARNNCPGAQGTLGTGSSGVQRAGMLCP
jgi:hypothetical protein